MISYWRAIATCNLGLSLDRFNPPTGALKFSKYSRMALPKL